MPKDTKAHLIDIDGLDKNIIRATTREKIPDFHFDSEDFDQPVFLPSEEHENVFCDMIAKLQGVEKLYLRPASGEKRMIGEFIWTIFEKEVVDCSK